jgi:predicted metal-binding membrane protein
MSLSDILSAARLIRPPRRRGFCPACRGWNARIADPPDRAETEISPPALTALVFVALAAVAWALTIWLSRSPAGMSDGMGIEMQSLESFAASWTVMMAAMMLPSALPLVYEFARRSEGRRRWQAATGVLAVTYLSVWLAFGVACYVLLSVWQVLRAGHGPVGGGVALALAGVYGLTPFKSASEARCRELCSLHGSLPFSLIRSAVIAGARYGLSCIGCSAGLMIAMAIIGMSNLVWAASLTAVVLVYKLAPAPGMRRMWWLSAALLAMAVLYGSTA